MPSFTASAGAPSTLAAGLDEHAHELVDGDLILVVTVGAGLNVIGALLRSGLEHAFPVHGAGWPWPTFAVNLVAVLVMTVYLPLQRRSARWLV